MLDLTFVLHPRDSNDRLDEVLPSPAHAAAACFFACRRLAATKHLIDNPIQISKMSLQNHELLGSLLRRRAGEARPDGGSPLPKHTFTTARRSASTLDSGPRAPSGTRTYFFRDICASHCFGGHVKTVGRTMLHDALTRSVLHLPVLMSTSR